MTQNANKSIRNQTLQFDDSPDRDRNVSYIPILYLNNQQLQKIIEVGGQWRDTLQIDEDNMSWAMKAKAAKKGPAGLFGRATGQSGWPVWYMSVAELQRNPSKIRQFGILGLVGMGFYVAGIWYSLMGGSN